MLRGVPREPGTIGGRTHTASLSLTLLGLPRDGREVPALPEAEREDPVLCRLTPPGEGGPRPWRRPPGTRAAGAARGTVAAQRKYLTLQV